MKDSNIVLFFDDCIIFSICDNSADNLDCVEKVSVNNCPQIIAGVGEEDLISISTVQNY